MVTLCDNCNKKKVGVISFNCKCEKKSLCVGCRLPDQHNCTYDFKKEWKKKLVIANPVVIKDKLERI